MLIALLLCAAAQFTPEEMIPVPVDEFTEKDIYGYRIFAAPKYYRDEAGTLLPIDTSIEANGDGTYTSEENTIGFTVTEAGAAIYTSDGETLTLTPNGISGAEEVSAVNATPAQHAKGAKAAVYGSKVTIASVFSNGHAAYEVLPGRVKETIYLQEPFKTAIPVNARKTGLSWRIKSSLNPEMLPSGDVEFRKDGKAIFLLPAPTAVDAAGNAIGAEYALAGVLLTVRLDSAALKTAVYPVAVDPTVAIEPNTSDYCAITYDSSYYKKLLLKFALPALASRPFGARLRMTSSYGLSVVDQTVEVYTTDNAWTYAATAASTLDGAGFMEWQTYNPPTKFQAGTYRFNVTEGIYSAYAAGASTVTFVLYKTDLTDPATAKTKASLSLGESGGLSTRLTFYSPLDATSENRPSLEIDMTPRGPVAAGAMIF